MIRVSDIVSGVFGDHTQGGFARDLQEVIRNFVKYALANWETQYLLLAGDVNVVPMRRLTGSSEWLSYGCQHHWQNPPPRGKCYFVAETNVAKLHPWFTPAASDPLLTQHGGWRLPYNQAASSSLPGWYYTTEEDLLNQDEGFTRLASHEPTQFVIVEGPGDSIDDNYYWLRECNSIPSDLYYASLLSPSYSSPDFHDFDQNDNGLYGQYHWDSATDREVSLDGVDFASDVWVGRAPVETASQAKAFVDKILTYEKLETTSDQSSVDPAYLKKILYSARSDFPKGQVRQSDTSIPPEEGSFTHVAGTNITKIHTQFDQSWVAGRPSHRLLASTVSNEIIDYDPSADAANLGWFFCSDDTYSTQSATPTRFVQVQGPESEIYPWLYLWDEIGVMNYQIENKELLRSKMNAWFTSFDAVQRHYDDHFDLTPPPPLIPLLSQTIRTAVDEGIHFLSMSGHGTADGCCGLSREYDFANTHKYFIAFADSCSTASPDDNGDDSLGEMASYDPDGGAVGYVGYTRESFSPFGSAYEQLFWGKLSEWGRLGPPAGLRWGAGGERWIWMTYALNLYGDPEMPVFTEIPSLYDVSYPAAATWGSPVYVSVRESGAPLVGHRVTLMGGWSNSSQSPRVFLTKTTNRFGHASFRLPSDGSPPADVSITVSHANFKPFQATIPIRS